MLQNQGYNELERMRHRSPSPMASSDLMSQIPGGWNGFPQEVINNFTYSALKLLVS